MKKQPIFRLLLIVGSGVLVLFFAVLSVLSVVPEKNETGLSVSETLTVSYSKQAKDSGVYIHQLSGRIFNDSGKAVTLRSLEVLLEGKDGEERTVIVAEGDRLLPRTEQEIFLEWSETSAYDHVRRIRAVTDAGEGILPNGTGSGVSAGTVLFGFLTLLCVGILLWSIRQYRYGLEEAKMNAANGKND